MAKETLGMFLAMNGNNKDAIIKLRNKTKEFAEQLYEPASSTNGTHGML
jgi:hypothetical protein